MKPNTNTTIAKISAITLSSFLLFGCNDNDSNNSSAAESNDEATVTNEETVGNNEESTGNSVLIQDTSTDEAGEIRFNLDAAQVAGKLSVNIRVDAAESELSSIALFGSSTSTDNAVIDLKMGSNNSDTEDQIGIKLRAKKVEDVSQPDIETGLEYPSNTWVNVSIAWDTVQAQVTITISDLDGFELGSEVHDMQTVVDVEKIIFKIGDSSGLTTSDAPYYIDDIIVTDETDTILISDDFSESTLNARYTTKSSVAVTNAQNATISDEADSGADTNTETETNTETVNYAASIIDTTLTADGELRLQVASITAGSVSATIQLQADADTQSPSPDNTNGSINNTAYINVYSATASSNNLVGEISFVSNGLTNYRDTAKSQQLIEGLTYSENTAFNAKIRWDDTNYWVSLDDGFEYGPYVGIFAGNPVTHIQFRIGNSTGQATNEMIVDNVVIADEAGNSILSENFDTGFSEDEALNSTYSNSAEATVVEIDL